MSNETRLAEEQVNLDRINGLIERKADLVDGKVPYEQLPDALSGNGADTTLSNVKSIASGSAVQQALDKKAGIDLSNTGRITNCITKIPQDIKLVLNSNGSITLKAGSVVYDGAGNKINITKDIISNSGFTGILFTNASGTSLFTNKLNSVRSGETEPEEIGIWYDTINKVVKFKGASSSSYSGEYSLPIALVSAGSSTTAAYSAIDQVFNGFGFIGNVAFVLPGVACLRTGGRNADGTLTSLASSFTQLIIPSNAEVILRTECYLSGNNNASMVPIGSYAYNEDKNNFINISDGALRNLCFAFSVTRDDTGRILSLTPQNVFRAVDYGDTNHIAVQGKPSEKSKDLTLSSSGAQYTAPANGWFYLEKTANSGEYIEIKDGVGGASQYAAADEQGLKLLYPTKAGRMVTINYTASGTTGAFRFIYDEGAK